MKPRKKFFLKILRVFDYFKEAFAVNKANRVIYKPTVLLMAIKVVIVIAICGVSVSFIENVAPYISYYRMDSIQNQIIGYVVIIIILVLLLMIGELVVDPGVSYMRVRASYEGGTSASDFWVGVKKYFWSFLLGKLLIAVAMMILAIPIALVSIIAGAAVAISVSVFVVMWKPSLIINNNGIIEAIKDGFTFGKHHFLPLGLVIMIQNAIVYGGSSSFSSGYNVGSNISTFSDVLQDESLTNFNFAGLEEYVAIGIGVVIFVVVLAIVAMTLYNMVINTFFWITYVVMYKDGFLFDNEVNNSAVEGEVIYE